MEMEIGFRIVLIGVLATLFMDLWSYILSMFNIKSLDYRLVGRWIGHFKDGVFTHSNIAKSTPVSCERILGWAAHYLIGITFSFVLVIIFGTNWLEQPTVLPALIIGIVTIIAPFFIMQPAFGFGIAASKTSNATLARFKSLMSHSIYGLGLYLGAILVKMFFS
jgi:hypothetical protein